MKRIYCIITLEETYIETFKVFHDFEAAQKEFKKILADRGLGILARRSALKAEFYRDGIWQIQFIKTEAK